MVTLVQAGRGGSDAVMSAPPNPFANSCAPVALASTHTDSV